MPTWEEIQRQWQNNGYPDYAPPAQNFGTRTLDLLNDRRATVAAGAGIGSVLGPFGSLAGAGIGGVVGSIIPSFITTERELAAEGLRNFPSNAPPEAQDAYFDAARAATNRGDIRNAALAASSAGREVNRQRGYQQDYLDFARDSQNRQRDHELNIIDRQAQAWNAQAQADAMMRGMEFGAQRGMNQDSLFSNERIAGMQAELGYAGLGSNERIAGMQAELGYAGLGSNERIAQGNNATQLGIAGMQTQLGYAGLGTQERIAQGNNATQFGIANLQGQNALEQIDAQGGWNTLNNTIDNATQRYAVGRQARQAERIAGMQAALQAADIANRQLSYWGSLAR